MTTRPAIPSRERKTIDQADEHGRASYRCNQALSAGEFGKNLDNGNAKGCAAVFQWRCCLRHGHGWSCA